MNAIRSLYQEKSKDATTAATSVIEEISVSQSGSSKRINVTDDSKAGRIRVDHFSEWYGNLQLRIYGISGNEVYSKSSVIIPGNNRFKIELNELNDGTFIVETMIRNPREGILTTYNTIDLKTKNF